jgi:hypothetical protein
MWRSLSLLNKGCRIEEAETTKRRSQPDDYLPRDLPSCRGAALIDYLFVARLTRERHRESLQIDFFQQVSWIA